MTRRLDASSLAALHPSAVPDVDRDGPCAVVHLGVGAFMRAHLGTYAEDLLRAGWPARIHGVSLRHPDAESRLGPQDGLYSLLVREPDRDDAPVVVGSLCRVSTGASAAIEAIAAPSTRMVTLTVTEHGYRHQGDASTNDTSPAGDVPSGDEPSAAASVIVAGLARRDRATPAPVVASLDNVVANGRVLAAQVEAAAARVDPSLARWIHDEVRFPISVVDRMAPASTAADLDEVEARLGLRDEAAVVCEAHRSWAIERVDGLAPLDEVGVEVTDDITTLERRKLRLLNGPHSALALGGLVAGCDTIAEAAAHPLVGPLSTRIAQAAVDVAGAAQAGSAQAFATIAMRRFANPALGHTCRQVAADSSEKVGQRLVPVVVERCERGLPVRDHAVVVACWLAAVVGIAVDGFVAPAPADPVAAALRSAARRGGIADLAAEGLPATVPAPFLHEVTDALGRLATLGLQVLGAVG